jgi:hypothetical protein
MQVGDLIEIYLDRENTFSAFFEVKEICRDCGDVVLQCADGQMLYGFMLVFTADEMEQMYIRTHIPKTAQRPYFLEVIK